AKAAVLALVLALHPALMATASATPYMCGGLGATIVGTSGDDELKGTAGADVIVGLGGNDTIQGLDGNDTICGDEGKDDIDGGAGTDIVWGMCLTPANIP